MGRTSKQSDFTKDWSTEAVKNGGYKALGDVVGLPDKVDKENIQRIIADFRKFSMAKYGKDILAECIEDAKNEHALAGNQYGDLTSKYTVVNKEANGRHMADFPEEFLHVIQAAYPLMFRDKKHFAWFCHNFNELLIPEKH